MHAGTRVVRLQRSNSSSSHQDDDAAAAETWSFTILAKFDEHKSMNYGSDVQPFLTNNNDNSDGDTGHLLKTIVSTSFYDRLLCLWRVPT